MTLLPTLAWRWHCISPGWVTTPAPWECPQYLAPYSTAYCGARGKPPRTWGTCCSRYSMWPGHRCIWRPGNVIPWSWPSAGAHCPRLRSCSNHPDRSIRSAKFSNYILAMRHLILCPSVCCCQGPLEENNVTGRLEPKEAPAWQRRAFRYLVSFPVIGLCLCVVFAVMFLMLRFQVSTHHTDCPNTLTRQSRGRNVAACEGISIFNTLCGQFTRLSHSAYN